MDQKNDDKKKELERLAKEVLTFSCNSLFVHLRYMDLALGQLKPIPVHGFPYATDGRYFFYDPMTLLKDYQKVQCSISHGFLHVVLHCIFRHMFADCIKNRPLWDLACDIAVEEVISELNLSVTKTPDDVKRLVALSEMRKSIGTMTAEKIYAYYQTKNPGEEKIRSFRALFSFDEHALWYDPKVALLLIEKLGGSNQKDGVPYSVKIALLCEGYGEDGAGPQEKGEGDRSGSKEKQDPSASSNEEKEGENGNEDQKMQTLKAMEAVGEKWKDVAERIKEDLDTFSKQHGDQAGALVQNLREVTREKYDYTSFLKKFATMHEDLRVNDDEFDYVYYTYGLQLYGKMPLVEPLEYKDVKKIKEFVIAIDTSGSVSGDLVQSFLQKTFNILKNEESFFRKFNLHIVQCDATVQEDAKVTTQKEFDEYIRKMTLRGFGGTDFRPVFDYVDALIKKKEFSNLKGLIYFTDGYGDYPANKPPYEVAFVFVGEEGPEVPAWAIKLVLKKEEI